MTIPTREEALRALDKLSSDYDLAGGWTPDPMPLLAALRSYIESHTGEVVAWMTVETDGKVRTTHKEATADMWRSIVGSKVSPLCAAPVQPMLEWEPKGRLGNFGHRQLIFNGKVIGTYRKTTGYIGQPRADELEVMAGRNCKGDFLRQAPFLDWQTEADIEANMEQRARQWLSGGDK